MSWWHPILHILTFAQVIFVIYLQHCHFGIFEDQALRVTIQHFLPKITEPGWRVRHPDPQQDSPFVIYCTGGIVCRVLQILPVLYVRIPFNYNSSILFKFKPFNTKNLWLYSKLPMDNGGLFIISCFVTLVQNQAKSDLRI